MIRANSVLGLHPSARGFGWALLEGKPLLIDCGAVEIREKNKNARAIRQIEALMAKWRPGVVALEDVDDPTSLRRARVRRLYRSIAQRARHHGILVRILSRAEIGDKLSVGRRPTRRTVAMAVVDKVDVLRPKLRPKQKIWVGEDHNMGLFCAAACALCCFTSVTDQHDASSL